VVEGLGEVEARLEAELGSGGVVRWTDVSQV